MITESKAAQSRALKSRLLLVSGRTYHEGPTYEWLREVIATHPDASGKLEDVSAIEVRRTTRMGNTFPELTLHLTNGGQRDCSWKACVYGKESLPLLRRKAMRHAVKDQVEHVRDQANAKNPCVVCGQLLGHGAWHVDHLTPSFELLASAYLVEMGEGLPLVELPEGGYALAEGYWREAWREYHWKSANLVVVHAGCNLRRGRGE